MLVKTVKVSSKGQITLPADAIRALGAKKGVEFLLVQENGRILLVKADQVAQRSLDELGGWENLAAPAFADLWNSPTDEIWDET